MELENASAEIFIPDGLSVDEAIERTTHLAIAAHQDDIEIMAYDGILKCFGNNEDWFMGVVVTDGSGSPRDGLYADYTDEEMQVVRRKEQKKAAYVGEYSAQVFLDYPSSDVKEPTNREIIEEFKNLIKKSRPKVLYTHNLADKHDTHVAVAVKVIEALRELPCDMVPQKVYGCEVWRSLDWMNDDKKVKFDVGSRPNLELAVLGVFDSQICGGKRYDLATSGRRIANATYAESHGVDRSNALIYAMDLTRLVKDKNLDINEFIQEYIRDFAEDVSSRIKRMT